MSQAALQALLRSTPTSTTVTMTTPIGNRVIQTGAPNTGSYMGSPGTSDYIYIALGGGIAGGILCLVILLLLVVVCCLAAKMIRNERYGNQNYSLYTDCIFSYSPIN